jgi:hypothetical protein
VEFLRIPMGILTTVHGRPIKNMGLERQSTLAKEIITVISKTAKDVEMDYLCSQTKIDILANGEMV